MASSRKKTIVRLEDGTVHAGYLPVPGVVSRAAKAGDQPSDKIGEKLVELLDPAGRIVAIPLRSVRWVAYVRDFNLDDTVSPERRARRTFLARPRTEGLWVRVTMRDGEVLEGLAGLDISVLDDAAADEGIFLLPPDVRSNTQRLYIPRGAMTAMAILGVVTSPAKAAAKVELHSDGRDALLPFPER